MTSDDILVQLTAIFRKELGSERVELRPETTAKDVEGWDSLTHVQLIFAVESHFKIKFTSSEIRNFKNVGQLRDAVIKRTNVV